MDCTKIQKEVLGIKTLGSHSFAPLHVDKFSENLYRLTEVCDVCGTQKETILRFYELRKIGFTEEQIRNTGYYHKTFHSDREKVNQ